MHAYHSIVRRARRIAAPTIAAIVLLGLAGPAQAAAAEPDTTPPTTPGTVVVVQTTTQGFTLTWAPSSDNVGVTHYRISTFYPPGSLAPYQSWQTPTNWITVTNLYPGQTVPLIIQAFDAAGNGSPYPYLPMVTVTTAGPVDRIPPTAPGRPVISGLTCAPNCSAVLSWTPSTDNVAVINYGIREIGVYGGVTIGTSRTTSLKLGGLLKPSQTYTFVVFALDPGMNRSPESVPVSVTVPPAAASSLIMGL